jgi:hypothetical protein
VERLQKLVVTQMGCGKQERHKPIMAGLELIAIDFTPTFCASTRTIASFTASSLA